MYRQLMVASICIFSLFVFVNAQDQTAISFSIPGPNELSLIKMKGDPGITYVGSIVEHNQKELTILTDVGTKNTVSLSNVQDIRVIPKSQIHDGEYWYPNPNEYKYLLTQSGFNLKKGEISYQNTYLLFHTFNWGVTDNLSIGIGFEVFGFLFSRNKNNILSFAPIYVFSPKYSIQVSENVRVGAQILYGQIFDVFNTMAIGYGLVTYGNPEHNATLGLGYGYFDYGYPGRNTKPVITLSGTTRITKHVSLITENLYYSNIPYYKASEIFSYGIRIIWETMSLDIAMLNNREIFGTIPIGFPFIDLAIKY